MVGHRSRRPSHSLAAGLTQTTGGVTTTNTEQFWYDHLGRRTVRMVNGGQVLSQYLYNGADIYEEYGSTFLQPLSRFTHGPATDDPLLVENANGRYYYHADARGSVSLMTDTAGTSGAWRRYDPWGRVLAGAGTLPQYGFTGREPDLTTGLMYYRARYYDPALGRFTSVDPLGPAGGINAYAYADNDPVSNTDPDGLMPQSTVNRGLQGIMPTYFDRQFGLGGPSITWRPSPLEQAQTSAAVNARMHAAAQFALGFIPGYDLVRTAMNPRADALDWTTGVLGVLPGLGKGAVMGAKGIYAAAAPLIGGAVREVRAVEAARGLFSEVAAVRNAVGKGNNITVGTQREAEAILHLARPNIPWRETYGPKTKIGAEIHPADGSGIAPGRQVELPHIKWRDWSGGKGIGAEGHIYFDSVNGAF